MLVPPGASAYMHPRARVEVTRTQRPRILHTEVDQARYHRVLSEEGRENDRVVISVTSQHPIERNFGGAILRPPTWATRAYLRRIPEERPGAVYAVYRRLRNSCERCALCTTTCVSRIPRKTPHLDARRRAWAGNARIAPLEEGCKLLAAIYKRTQAK